VTGLRVVLVVAGTEAVVAGGGGNVTAAFGFEVGVVDVVEVFEPAAVRGLGVELPPRANASAPTKIRTPATARPRSTRPLTGKPDLVPSLTFGDGVDAGAPGGPGTTGGAEPHGGTDCPPGGVGVWGAGAG